MTEIMAVTPGTVFTDARLMITDTDGVTEIENSEVRKIAQDVLDAAKYSFVAVAANPNQAVRADSLEAVFKDALSKMPEAKRSTVRKQATEIAQTSQTARQMLFGRYGALDTQSFLGTGGFNRAGESLGELAIDKKLLGIRQPTLTLPLDGSVRVTSEGLLVPASALPNNFEDFESAVVENSKSAAQSELYDTQRLADIWGPVYGDSALNQGRTNEFEAAAVTNKLALYISQVKCVDETNPEFWGSDEIALAGVTVDETGDTNKVNEQYVGGGFDDGDAKNYNPHWRYTWFNLTEGSKWPKHYSVSLILAEKDNGGLSDVLNTIWLKVRDYVKSAIEKAVTGVLSEYLGPVIASAIGKAVAWIIDKLVGWIIGLFKDDVFPPFTASTNIPSYNARWTLNGTWGATWSGYRYAHFYGYGGHYQITYYWQLFA